MIWKNLINDISVTNQKKLLERAKFSTDNRIECTFKSDSFEIIARIDRLELRSYITSILPDTEIDDLINDLDRMLSARRKIKAICTKPNGHVYSYKDKIGDIMELV